MSDKSISQLYVENMEKGKFYYKDGDMERSSYHFSLSLELEETPENLFYMGLISSQRMESIEALGYFYRSIELDPEYGNPCNEIGVILLRHGREREAIFWLKRSIRSKNNDAPHIPLYNLATLYKMWNRPERSLQYLYKALDIAPEFEEAIRLRDEITSTNS